jgi:hypothetical protein
MKHLLLLNVLLFSALALNAQTRKPRVKPKPTPTPAITETEATTKDGRKVVLKSNYTWEYSKVPPVPLVVPPTPAPTPIGTIIKSPFKNEDFKGYDWKEIPKDFVGQDLAAVTDILKVRFEGKGEFETTVAYQTRLVENKQKNIFELLPFDSTLVFKASYLDLLLTNRYSTSKLQFKAEYNADRETYKISFYTLYGANTEIPYKNKDTFTEYQVDFANLEQLFSSEGYGNKTYSFTFPLSVEKAKSLKLNFVALFLFKLKEPFVRSYSSTIIGNLNEIWIYNEETGEIITKQKIGNLKSASAAPAQPK